MASGIGKGDYLVDGMDLYGLIGKKLGHSFSAGYFNDKFLKEGIDAAYELFPLPKIGLVQELVTGTPNLLGLNVTIPYKQTVINELAWCSMSETAEETQSVNTIKIIRSGNRPPQLEAHNTDVSGFHEAVAPLLKGRSISGALVLGAGGGAAQSIKYALRRYFGIVPLGVSRNPSDAAIGYGDITKELLTSHPLIVNCTPLGMWPDVEDAPHLPYECISSRNICFDLVYNPRTTRFMRECAVHGATVENGLKMLVAQAEAAWKIWRRF